MSEGRSLLDVQNLNAGYGRSQVLFDLTMLAPQRGAVAILGRNGAGKSTLLKVIAALVTPTHGHVRIDGEDVTSAAPGNLVRRGLILLRGGQGVFKDMTVAENLDVQGLTLRHLKGESARRRDRVLATFPALGQRAGFKAGLLSGGEQQQLVLAKAIMLEPKILCIDELSLGLAPIVVQELLSIVRSIHGQGTSIILVEQSLNIASEVCERAVFLEKGQVRFEGPTRQLLESDDIARAVFLGA